MKRYLLFLSFISLIVLSISGCGDPKVQNPTAKAEVLNSGKISNEITIGSEMKPFTFKDQFDKNQTLKSDTKKLILVFKKATGHLVKEYFNKKSVDFMEKNSIQLVADVSKMPSMILKMVAIPDLKEHKYPIMLITDEKISANYKNEKDIERVWIVTLDNYVVKNVTFVSNEADLAKEVESK